MSADKLESSVLGRWYIECDECGENDDLPQDYGDDKKKAAEHFYQYGWREYRGGSICNDCAEIWL